MATHLSKDRVVQVLRKALDKIKNVGWTKGRFTRHDHPAGPATCYCLYGAVMYSTNSSVVQDAAIDALTKESGHFDIILWNDDPRRRVGDVLGLLRKVIRQVARG